MNKKNFEVNKIRVHTRILQSGKRTTVKIRMRDNQNKVEK